MKTSIYATMIAATVAAAGAAHASTITVQYTGTQRGQNVAIQSPDRTGNVFAGQLKHTLSDGPAELNGDWITYCADLAQGVSGTPRTFEVVDIAVLPGNAPMGAAKASAIADLYAFAGGSQLLATASNDFAAAFQLAVWEIITDYNPSETNFALGITTGNFRATRTDGNPLSSGVMNHLTSLFAAVGAGHNPDTLLGLRSTTHQDQIIPVPAPGSAALAGLGLLCLAGRRRIR